MTTDSSGPFASLPTPFKLLLMLSLALLPIGALLTWSAIREVRDADVALDSNADSEMLAAARSIEALIARNALALRVAASGAFASGEGDPCRAADQSLEVTPAVARQFTLVSAEGDTLCGDFEVDPDIARDPVPAGNIDLWINGDGQGLMLRVGLIGGTATGRIETDELRNAAVEAAPNIDSFQISDGDGRMLEIVSREIPTPQNFSVRASTVPIAGQRLRARLATDVADITTGDRLLIYLPVLMFAAALLVSWALVHYLLMRPLAKLHMAIARYEPEEGDFALPARLGPAQEIRDLGGAFVDAVHRVEESEQVMADALEGQRKLVREVHHRVKNNLQVVASLLNIHSRGASGDEARSAYAGIGRRVEALAVVHRNHFAEVEESRGIQLRPLLTELASSLRASADEHGSSPIDLDLETASTTQDVAVAIAFLVTEVVEHVLNHGSGELIEISLHESSEITARLAIASEALVERESPSSHVQFERIIDGLARQLRSPLEKKLGRYSVEFPIFPKD